MRRINAMLFMTILISMMTCGSLGAQATGEISGTVRDQSGAVLPGVAIQVTQTDTGITRDTISNEAGYYALPSLLLGPYRLEASLPGFRTYAQSGIVLQVNSNAVINPVLEVGQVTEQVEVQANATLVETRNAGIAQVMENARILELPLDGRNVVQLIALSGAATPATQGVNGRNPFANTVVSVAGGLSESLTYTLDGANHNNPHFNTYMSMPFPDALQEFRVDTSASGAQNGVKSAGSVSLVTKSGTNQLHGNLFEFVRNGMFNARNAFATRRDTIKRNQFGGTVGGPIARNKVFFFAGYQGTTIRQDPEDVIKFVPTPAMLAGDFTTFASAACNAGRAITLRAPFAGNRMNPALFSKAAVAIASKLPSTSDPCGRITYGNPRSEELHMVVARIDYQRSTQHSLFGRVLTDRIDAPSPFSLNKNPLSSPSGTMGRNYAFALGDTFLFNANVVNSIRFAANRLKSDQRSDPLGFGLPDVGVKMFTHTPGTFQLFRMTGGFTLGGTGGPAKVATFSVDNDLSVLRANHQIALGANISTWWVNSYSTAFSGGHVQFTGQTTGLGMADFFTGSVAQFQMAPPAGQNKQSKYIGLYASDTWKVNPKLTLNYGLRWEPYFPMIHRDGSAIHFDIDDFRKGIKSRVFTNAPPGFLFNGDPGFPGLSGMYNKWWNFSPRVGLAWNVTGDGRTSVRASVGTFYDYPSTDYQVGLASSPPWLPKITMSNVPLDDPWSGYPGGDPFPMPYGRSVPRDVAWPLATLVTAMDYDAPNMRVAQWNLSLQKQIGEAWLMSASYLGSGTTHLWTIRHLNPGIYIPGGPCTLNGVTYNPCSSTANLNQRRLISLENPQIGQYIGYVHKIDTGGTASYNGLVLSVQRRAASGVVVNGNYTWSHCISDKFEASANKGTGTDGGTHPENRRFDRGNCTTSATDRRHVVSLSAVAETPRFSSPTARIFASGWRFSPIIRLLSGGYLTVTTSSDIALTGIAGQYVKQILGNPYGDKSVNNFLNPAAFALPATGTYGDGGSGKIAGPGTWQFDAALSRTFQLRETQKLEFRAEAFNVANAFRMENPDTVLNSNTFGQVTSAKDPRIMQFVLKYFF